MYNCNDPAIKEIQSELYKRLIKPIYIFILALTAGFLFLSSKENNFNKTYRLIIFFIGLVFIIIAELANSISNENFIVLITLLLIPIMISLIQYLFLIKEKNFYTKMISIHKKYIYRKFFICLGKVSIAFGSIIIVMNLFEEISFFKNEPNSLLLPVFLTLLNLPSLLFEIFPFIFFISSIYFFIETFELDEINTYKIYGIPNLKLIQILSFATFITGILIITLFYTLSTNKFLFGY